MNKLLRVLILEDMAQRGATMPRDQANMWGEDFYRCKDWLDKFTKAGLVEKRPMKPNRRSARSVREDAYMYVPNVAKISDELKRSA
jgi:hypothetical protein